MGEGWSDWYAEDFLNNLGFKPDTGTIGDVVMGAITFNGSLRYQAVDCPVVLPLRTAGSPAPAPADSPTEISATSTALPEVHSDGEIWLETLWQIRQTLGAAVTEALVTRGMELSPPAPSFLDMRNAIIQADLVNFGGANETALWTIFAQRGMGYFAASDSGDVDPIEDFTAPPDCAVSDCATLSGTVKDKSTGKPAAGVQVSFPGLDSGFASDLADTTDGTGYHPDVPLHTYAELRSAATGTSRHHQRPRGHRRPHPEPEGRSGLGTEGEPRLRSSPARLRSVRLRPEQLLDLNLGTGCIGRGRHVRATTTARGRPSSSCRRSSTSRSSRWRRRSMRRRT
jgi:hypothetical protein